jgi:hypothetical protein
VALTGGVQPKINTVLQRKGVCAVEHRRTQIATARLDIRKDYISIVNELQLPPTLK